MFVFRYIQNQNAVVFPTFLFKIFYIVKRTIIYYNSIYKLNNKIFTVDFSRGNSIFATRLS